MVRITVSNFVRLFEVRVEIRGFHSRQTAGIVPRHVRIINAACSGARAFCRSACIDFPGVAEVVFGSRPARLIPVYVCNESRCFSPVLRNRRVE